MPLIEEAHKAARVLLDHAYVRILARDEPDAVCAATLLAHALRRDHVDFHVGFVPRYGDATHAALAEERADCLLLVGLSGDASSADAPAVKRVVLDKEPPTLAGDAVVHADAALSSLAHLVAAGMSKRNRDLAPLALAGAVADLRHVAGGPRGLDRDVMDEALEAHVVLREPALALHGTTLLAALSQLDAPFVPGLTGRARNAKKLVGELGLNGDAPPASVAPESAERLGSFLTARLLQHAAPDAALDALFRANLRGLQGPHTGLEAGEMARVVEAACAAGRPGLGFSALWPDAAAGGEAVELAGPAREEMVAALLRAERDARREGRLLVAEAPRAALARPLADRLALSLAPEGHVAVAHAPAPEGAFLALRSFGPDAGALARKAAAIAGGAASGDARGARFWSADASRAVKALAEALG